MLALALAPAPALHFLSYPTAAAEVDAAAPASGVGGEDVWMLLHDLSRHAIF